ncbi:MAG: hypothetical protein ACM3X0_08545 [Bacteroidota bacterium]
MQTIHDVDVLLLLATLLAAKRKPAELLEIVAAIDLAQGNVPAAPKLCESFSRLAGYGLLVAADGGYALTPDAQALVTRLPKKAETAERLFLIKDRLSEYSPKGEHPVVTVAEADVTAAITAHRAAAASPAKNLLVPKPKPEVEKARPGQRQRKPLAAKRRKD